MKTYRITALENNKVARLIVTAFSVSEAYKYAKSVFAGKSITVVVLK